jgi:hypothetical protein
MTRRNAWLFVVVFLAVFWSAVGLLIALLAR